MADEDLDFSGFQVERKVDVPPPSKPKSAGKKSKKKKAKSGKKRSPRPAEVEGAKSESKGQESKVAVRGSAAPTPRTGRKKRVNVSLPLEVSRLFTERAALEDRYLTDMVLDAYRDHFATMRDDYVAQQGDHDLLFRPRRRKAATGRVTHMLYLAAPEVAVIDGSAAEIGLSRSEFVSQLLQRDL